MKHEITSMNTKKLLSSSLKKLMEHKKLSKITVSEIIADCGVNRKTFYYHFEDKYELLNWIYYTEGFARLVDGITLENWDSGQRLPAPWAEKLIIEKLESLKNN